MVSQTHGSRDKLSHRKEPRILVRKTWTQKFTDSLPRIPMFSHSHGEEDKRLTLIMVFQTHGLRDKLLLNRSQDSMSHTLQMVISMDGHKLNHFLNIIQELMSHTHQTVFSTTGQNLSLRNLSGMVRLTGKVQFHQMVIKMDGHKQKRLLF
jgi:hypothetical protein